VIGGREGKEKKEKNHFCVTKPTNHDASHRTPFSRYRLSQNDVISIRRRSWWWSFSGQGMVGKKEDIRPHLQDFIDKALGCPHRGGNEETVPVVSWVLQREIGY